MSLDPQYTELVLTKPVDLDKLAGAQISTQWKFDTKSLAERTKAMFAHLDGLKKERAVKAILAGLYLHEVKLALGHGAFGAWKKENFTHGHSQIANYMALAAKFSRSAKLLLPELVSAEQITLDLRAENSDAATLKTKLEKFVGGQGLTDLLRKHGIVKQGGNQRPEKGEEAQPTELAKLPTPEELAAAEEAAAGAAFKSASDALDAANAVLLGEVVWASLTPQSAELIDSGLKALAAKFHERVLEARHVAA